MYKTNAGHSCFLVALEGADMVGKATQAHLLETALIAAKIKATTEEIPYADEITHSIIYEMLEDGTARKSPDAFQAVQCLNRIAFWRHYLPTLAFHHEVIIFDRWTLSTRVYGKAGGANPAVTESFLRHVEDADLNIIIDAPPWPKAAQDVLESDNPFQTHVRELYLKECISSPTANVKIDGSRPAVAVHQEVLACVMARLKIAGSQPMKKDV
jgi:thymidylate kinase